MKKNYQKYLVWESKKVQKSLETKCKVQKQFASENDSNLKCVVEKFIKKNPKWKIVSDSCELRKLSFIFVSIRAMGDSRFLYPRSFHDWKKEKFEK